MEPENIQRSLIVRALELCVMIAVAVLVLDVLWGVLSRELARWIDVRPSPWTEEVATNLLIWVSLLGSAVAYERNEHLGLDYVVRKFSRDTQKIVALLSHAIVIAFAAAALLYGGTILVYRTLVSGQLTAALQMRMGYIYLAVPLCGALMVYFGLRHMIEILCDREDPFPTHELATADEITSE